MSIGQTTPVEVAAGTGLSLLVGLSAASRGPRDDLEPALADALDAVGDGEGETWLNLLGVALDAGTPYGSQQLLDALRTIDGVELRRHLLGRFAWSWCTLAGIDDIESAAAGNRSTSRRLLEHPRYYGGHATASLGTLLPLDAEETRARLVRAVEAAHGLGGSSKEQLTAAAAADAALSEVPPLTAIERLTGGYRYVPEVEAERVVLIPHLEPALPLVLAQHRSARLIAYLRERDRGAGEQLTVLGKAFADPKRVEILALVGRGVGRAGDLVDASGLTRSTVHHHLSLLRAAGLVALEGNARAYTYVPRRDAPTEVAELVAALLGPKEDQ
jgi:DNA-binding transcriptional ArsR family regulator